MSGQSLEIQENVALAPFTTLQVGGPARFFAEIRSEPELQEAVAFARENHLPIAVVGGGSNLLVKDAGFPGLVLHLAIDGATQVSDHPHHVELRVSAGTEWDGLVLQTCEMGLSGMECLAGIPGLTGGSPIQNIGAYGQEVSQTILSVRALDLRKDAFVELSNEDCHFGYRTSRFNASERGRFLVTAVTFRLEKDATPNLSYADLARTFPAGQRVMPLDVYHAVREIRRAKGMLLTPSDPEIRTAGSFFKNPVVTPEHFEGLANAAKLQPSEIPHWPSEEGIKLAAGWLIERAGFHKGFTLGRAGISSRHTLALVNRGEAMYADVAALRDRIIEAVDRQFHITLVQEPVELDEKSGAVGTTSSREMR